LDLVTSGWIWLVGFGWLVDPQLVGWLVGGWLVSWIWLLVDWLVGGLDLNLVGLHF
jgi:hypothetical protein